MLLGARVRLLVEEDGAVAGERELVVEDLEELGVEGVRDVVTTTPTVRVFRVIRVRAARFGV